MRKNTVFAVSVASFFAITAGLVLNNNAFADYEEEPDLMAVLEAGGDYKGKGVAYFWFDDDADPESLRYKIVLNHVKTMGDMEELALGGPADPGTKGKKGWDEVHMIHVHYAPDGVHNPNHLLNVYDHMMMSDPKKTDADLKITGQVYHGVWSDEDYFTGFDGDSWSDKLSENIENLCNGDVDVNVHLGTHMNYIRGQIYPYSDACSELFP